jgi:hypothetical protein
MPVSETEFATLKRRVERLEVLVRQLQGLIPTPTPLEVPDGQ